MKNILKCIYSAAFLLLFTILSTTDVSAGFGVSPTDIIAPHLKPGAVLVKEFTLSRSDELEQELDIVIESDFGDTTSWLSYEPGESFKFEKGAKQKQFKIKVTVPNDAELKDYEGIIRVKASPSESSGGGVSITKGLRMGIKLTVTEQDYAELHILSISTEDMISGEPVKIVVVGENFGNIPVAPSMKVVVSSLNMVKLEEHTIKDFGSVLPNSRKTLTAEFKTEQPVGEYFAEVTVLHDEKELRKERLVFRVDKRSEVVSSVEESSSLMDRVKEFISKYQTISLLAASLLLAIVIYILLTIVWKRKSYKKYIKKWWGICLGSKWWSRVLLSLLVGALLFALLMFTIKYFDKDEKDREESSLELTTEESGETQGVYDEDVVPVIESKPDPVNSQITEKGYPLFSSADFDSAILSYVKDGEQFDVVEERDGWFRVSFNGGYGWIHTTSISSKEVKDM